jgi:hypothetical protein
MDHGLKKLRLQPMIQFKTLIDRFGEQGEKTGWTFIVIPAAEAQLLKPGNKKIFRVKGKLDSVSIKQVALFPRGDGDFIMALKKELVKKLGKLRGETLTAELEEDTSEIPISPDLLDCLQDDRDALKTFNKLSPGHQRYYSNWIESAKTPETKAKRIVQALNGLAKGLHYGEMMRELKEQKEKGVI